MSDTLYGREHMANHEETTQQPQSTARYLKHYKSLLLTSKCLYDEAVNFLFNGGALSIDLNSSARIPFTLFCYGNHIRQTSTSEYLQGKVRTPLNMDPPARIFFPLHILDRIVVRFAVSSSAGVDDIFHIWRNVELAIELLKSAHSQFFRCLTFLFPCRHPGYHSPKLCDVDYKILLRLFGELRQSATTITLVACLLAMHDANPLEEAAHWTSARDATGEMTELASEQDLRCEMAKDWLDVCLAAATPNKGWSTSFLALQPLHLELIAAWMSQTSSGKSKFDERFCWIWANCRDII
ncbi:uncharacterized protein BDV17DRAFT_58578 [Aspergillus undulatus]|uniref:uncharacterized protein n=1 Tax=Aspergillus undulatus TaxID=1810928 RepID=UPI003CCD4DF3